MHLLIHYQHLLLGLVMLVVKVHHRLMVVNLAVVAVVLLLSATEDIPTTMVKVVMEHNII
jgi:hypothetical protein